MIKASLAVKFSKGNKDDRAAFEQMAKKQQLQGKCYGDKGYLSKQLFSTLYQQGLTLITGIRKNMKNYLMPLIDKIYLRKRFIIETIFGYMKENFNLKPNKHRSSTNFFAALLAALIAYQLKPNKPAISYP